MKPDFLVIPDGTIAVIRAESPRAETWLRSNLGAGEAQLSAASLLEFADAANAAGVGRIELAGVARKEQ